MQCFYRFSIALGMLVFLLMSGMVHADNKGIKRKTGRDFSQSPRKALVIGNGEYAVGRLKNPANDARDMARVLNDLGFDVALKLNLDRKGMFQAIVRVDRGGGWDNNAGYCRSAFRLGNSPGNRSSGLGFRLLRTP